MAIYTEKVAMANPMRRNDPKKWYIYNKSIGTVNEKEVARQLANRTSMNRKEAEMALYLLREILVENLLRGYTVKLSDWAYFYVTLTSEGTDTKEEATAAKIKRVRLHIRGEQSLEEELQKASFVPLASLLKPESENNNG